MKDYILYQSEFIENNQADIIHDVEIAYRLFQELFPNRSSTWTYHSYNVFSLTACSTSFYVIYQELRNLIREHLGNKQKLWIQAWINHLKYDEIDVLDWHGHDFAYHGYICIDPKKTNTVFENYTIQNKMGQIYLGPGRRMHRVEALEEFSGVRTTIGFDIVHLNETSIVQYVEKPWKNMSFIPLL